MRSFVIVVIFMFSIAIKFFAQLNDSEPNNDIASADTLPFNTIFTGQLKWQTDPQDWVRIIMPGPGILRIKTTVNGDAVQTSKMRLTLHSKGGAQFYSIDVNATNGSTSIDSADYVCIAADTFFLRLDELLSFCDPCPNACYNYTIELVRIPASFSDDQEPNNSTMEAIFLDENVAKEGTLKYRHYNGDYSESEDYYCIVPPDDGNIILYVESEHTSFASLLNINLKTKNNYNHGDQYPTNGSFGSPATDTLIWGCVQGQDTLYFKISSGNVNDCGISYKIRYALDTMQFQRDLEPNNSIAQSTELKHNTYFDGHLKFSGVDDQDYYCVVVPDTGYLKLYTQMEITGIPAPEAQSVNISLFDKNGGFMGGKNMRAKPFGGSALDTFDLGLKNKQDTFYLYIGTFYAGQCGISYRINYLLSPKCNGGTLHVDNTLINMTLLQEYRRKGKITSNATLNLFDQFYFDSEDSIELLPNFSVHWGTSYEADVGPCN